MKYKLFTSLFLFTIFSSNLWADGALVGNAKTGDNIYGMCAGCHGPSGEGNEAMNARRSARLVFARPAEQF